ncbi:MAG: hypothetical protein HY952_00995 [Elusimicrobia bacterium]|nr:hypothetical protein [Elusimicrobiota bacterium]
MHKYLKIPVVALAVLSIILGAAAVLSSLELILEDKRNVYVVFLDPSVFEINPGETKQIHVRVTPADQPIVFQLSPGDTRMEVSVDSVVGQDRIITIVDKTSPSDEPVAPSEIWVRAFLPDGSEAKTEGNSIIQGQGKLTEYFGSLFQRMKDKIDAEVNVLPQTANNLIGDYFRSQVKTAAESAVPPEVISEETLNAFRDATKYTSQGFCNMLGEVVGSNQQVKIDAIPVAYWNTRISRKPSPSYQTSIIMGATIGGVYVNTNGETGIKYKIGEFVQLSPLSFTFDEPITTHLNEFQADASLRSAGFKTKVSANWYLSNNYGGIGWLTNPNKIDVTVEWYFGGN